MNTKLLLTLLLFCFSWQLLAQQNPLVGTWQVVSIKVTFSGDVKGKDGKKIQTTTDVFQRVGTKTKTELVK